MGDYFNSISNYFKAGLGPLQETKSSAKPAKTANVNQTGYVQLTGTDSVRREDLDNLSPYAGLGVNIRKPEVTTESRIADVAQQDFGNFTGNYKLNNVQSANYDLADMRAKLNPEKFAAEYVNSKDIAANFDFGMLDSLDKAFGVA